MSGVAEATGAALDAVPDTFRVSVFSAPVSNTTIFKTVGWSELCRMLKEDIVVLPDNKTQTKAKYGQYFVRGKITGERNDDNLSDCCLLILDIDKPLLGGELPTVHGIHDALKDIIHVAYTSVTSGRSRVIILVEPYEKEQTCALTKQLYEHCRSVGLEFAYAGESNTASQPWFYGQTLDKNSFVCLVNDDGLLFNPDPDLVYEDAGTADTDTADEKQDTSKNRLADFIEQLKTGTIHQAAKTYAGWLNRITNLSKKQIFDDISVLVDAHCSDREKVQRWHDGERASLEAWFESNVEDQQEPATGKPMFITLSDVKEQSFTPEWLIYRQLEANSQNLYFGDSQSKKTFILIDQMMSIAAGIDWCGQPVKRGGVVFLYGEGSGGIIRRCRAWLKHHSIPESEMDNLLILNASLFVSLEKNSAENLIAQIHQAAEVKGISSINMIAWDTASSLLGIDENRADEVAEALRVIRGIGRQCDNASDTIIHHMGHGANHRPRGSYAWMANVDAWHLIEKSSQFQSKIKAYGKMKDADPITYNRLFDLNYQLLGIDDYNNEYGSLVACHVGNEEADNSDQRMSATDRLIDVVRGKVDGIFKASLVTMGESVGFKNSDSCRKVIERLVRNGRLQSKEGRIICPTN